MPTSVPGQNEFEDAFRPDAIALRTVPSPSLAVRSARTRPGIQRLNMLVAVLVMLLLVLAPIPLGSHRPAFALVWATYVGAVALLYGGALLIIGAPPRVGLADVWPELLLLLALCTGIALQMLPLGVWLPLPVSPPFEGLISNPRQLSLDPGSSSLVLTQFISYGLLYFLTAQVAINRRRARWLLYAVFLVVTAFAIYGMVALTQLGDTLLFFEKQTYLGYATGTFVNRNSFATFLAVGLVAGVAASIHVIAERSNITLARLIGLLALNLVALGFIVATLLATGSRMGLVSASAGIGVLVVLALAAYRGSIRHLGIGAGVLLLVALGGLVIFGTPFVERLVMLPGVDESRVEIHSQIWTAIWQQPWIGYGAGSFATVFQTLQQPPLTGIGIWEMTHSTYLALWFEMGLVVGSIPLAFIAIAAARALLALRDPSSKAVSLAAIAAVTVFAVHSLLDFSAEIEANAYLFTVLLALGAAGRMNGRTGADG
jgi:O-antigen ligase